MQQKFFELGPNSENINRTQIQKGPKLRKNLVFEIEQNLKTNVASFVNEQNINIKFYWKF